MLFTVGKSGKVPYGRLKKFFRDGRQLTGGNTDSLAPGKIERLLFFYHPDHLGSSSFITDVSGEVYQHVQYFPFGELRQQSRTPISSNYAVSKLSWKNVPGHDILLIFITAKSWMKSRDYTTTAQGTMTRGLACFMGWIRWRRKAFISVHIYILLIIH